jgi:hypothetical protein
MLSLPAQSQDGYRSILAPSRHPTDFALLPCAPYRFGPSHCKCQDIQTSLRSIPHANCAHTRATHPKSASGGLSSERSRNKSFALSVNDCCPASGVQVQSATLAGDKSRLLMPISTSAQPRVQTTPICLLPYSPVLLRITGSRSPATGRQGKMLVLGRFVKVPFDPIRYKYYNKNL